MATWGGVGWWMSNAVWCVAAGMFETKTESGANIITQGDDGDNFYVLGSGAADVRPLSP